jgi:hypothetical protein
MVAVAVAIMVGVMVAVVVAVVVGTVKDRYIRKVPLPRAHWIQLASHASHMTQDTCHSAQLQCIPKWGDLTRSLAALGRRALLPFPLL